MKDARNGENKPEYTYLAKKKYWRFRHGEMDVALPGCPGSVDFEAKYAQLMALAQKARPAREPVDCSTFSWLLRSFYDSAEFSVLAAHTQRDYRVCGAIVAKLLGDQSFRLTTRKMIRAVRDTMAGTPYQADKVKRFISRLYVHAQTMDLVEDGFNMASGIKKLKVPPGGYIPWSEDEIALMLKHASGVVRSLIIISLYTGQRPGDVIAMQWSQALGVNIRVRQLKTGELIDVPCHPVLAEELDRLRADAGGCPTGRIAMHRGKPLGEMGYYYHLRKLIRSIPNMPHRSPHGARFAAAARLEAAGCSVEQIVSVLGHRTHQVAMMYLLRRKNAQRAMERMVAFENRLKLKEASEVA